MEEGVLDAEQARRERPLDLLRGLQWEQQSSTPLNSMINSMMLEASMQQLQQAPATQLKL